MDWAKGNWLFWKLGVLLTGYDFTCNPDTPEESYYDFDRITKPVRHRNSAYSNGVLNLLVLGFMMMLVNGWMMVAF